MIKRGTADYLVEWSGRLLEADERLRNLQRRWESTGEHADLEAWHRAAEHSGRDQVSAPHMLRHHIDRHAVATRKLETMGLSEKKFKRILTDRHAARRAVNELENKHGLLAADHASRREKESLGAYRDRLVGLQQDAGTYKPPPSVGIGSTRASLNLDRRDGHEDQQLHRKRAEALARAWEKAGGRAEVGMHTGPDDEHGRPHIKGSWVAFSHDPEHEDS